MQSLLCWVRKKNEGFERAALGFSCHSALGSSKVLVLLCVAYPLHRARVRDPSCVLLAEIRVGKEGSGGDRARLHALVLADK